MDYKPKTVLIADDSETFMMYISIVLRRMGFDVIPAEDGIEALKLLGIFSPDVVLLDIDMPKMNGIETLKAIRENSNLAHLPVVIISVESSGGTYRECRQAGCSGYLTKPMKIAELNDMLQAHIVYERDRKRKHLRTTFEKKVVLRHGSISQDLHAVNLAEGGIYVRMADPLPVGSEVSISIPLNDESMLELDGTVIYKKNLYGEIFRIAPGIAVEFMGISEDKSLTLKKYIEELLTEDIE